MIALLADYHSAPTAALLILLVGIFAAAVWIAVTALRRPDEPTPRANPAVGKVVSGPALRDGVWCRLVAYPDGHRRVEVLGPKGWVPSHRNVADLMQAIPGRSAGPGKPPT
jgi:hypothetical protein